MAETLTIGKVARRSGVGVETVRFYEREGLIPPPPRRDSGYRAFPAETVRRIRFIRHAKDLGFTLEEIRELLALRVEGAGSCGTVRHKAQAKLADIDQRLAALTRMRKTLVDLSRACETGTDTGACPILSALDEEGWGGP